MTRVDLVPGLTEAQRSELETLVRGLRRLLEADLTTTAEGQFGLHLSGRVEPSDALTLTAAENADRAEVLDVLSHLRALGETPADAVARVIREAAFTHINRLLGIRVAEAIGVLPESLARGAGSEGFAEVAEVAPLVADDYLGYLDLCARELAADAPVLFDPRNPMLRLPMSARCAGEAVTLIGKVDPAIWISADTFGWAYQFFNSEDERREMREASAPRNSRELAVRNQFFTPRYVVDFLVQNTLGRRLLPSIPALAEHLPLLVDPPAGPGLPIELRDIKILDPACGSGHFLLGAYDLLEIAWSLQGAIPVEAAPHIVNSLWGVDIDPRCAQVAAAAIVMRARRRTPHSDLPRPNIVCARGLPLDAHRLVPGLDFDETQLLKAVEEALADAPNLGVLLRAEDRMEAALDQVLGSAEVPTLTGHMNIVEREQQLRRTVARLAEVAQATPAERLLAAEIDDALRLWEVCRTRFTVVLMNPPFGEPVPDSKNYLEAAYPDCPGREILCAFVERGVELCAPDGFLGALTSRGPLFLKTGEAWRANTILGNRLTAVADLGFGVMEQALVEAAAYVIAPRLSGPERSATVLRLLKDVDRPTALRGAASNARAELPDHRVFRVTSKQLTAVPGAPLAYWLHPALRRLFTDLPQVEGDASQARVGLQTGDDARFLRLFWEVDPEAIALTRDDTRSGKRWVPFAKGGGYSPYWSDIHLVVDWEANGHRLREFGGSVIRNEQYYFRPGLTWPRRTASGFGLRALPEGCAFGDKGPALIAGPDGVWPLLAWLQSRHAAALIQPLLAAADETSSEGPSKSYEVGIIQRLPQPSLTEIQAELLATHSKAITALRRSLDSYDETCRTFRRPDLEGSLAAAADAHARRRAEVAVECIAHAAEAEGVLADALALPATVLEYLDEEIGPSVNAYPMSVPSTQCIADISRPLEGVINEALAERGGARFIAYATFVADRQLEVLAHIHGVHPASIEEARRTAGALPMSARRDVAAERLSYLFGVAMGRWDLSVGSGAQVPSAVDPLAPVPVRPPGMRLTSGRTPVMLVDEPGHPLDAEPRLGQAATAIWGVDAGERVAEICGALSVADLRDGLRRVFWKDHLIRYSNSRRQAPLYWPIGVPSRQWGLWLYAPLLNREALFAVAAEGERRSRLADDLVAQLTSEQPSGGRSARQIATELAAERRLQVELTTFCAEATHLAGLGWEPDLNDGFILCAAMMAKLLPLWREASAKRRELKAGKYAWSESARWAGHL